MKNKIPSHEEIERMLHENVCDIVFESGNRVVETRATLIKEFYEGQEEYQRVDENSVKFWDMDIKKGNKWQEVKYGDIRLFHERLKPCTLCKKNKPVSAFERSERRPDGYRWERECNECKEFNSNFTISRKELTEIQRSLPKYKKFCNQCRLIKPRSSDFFVQKTGHHGTPNGLDRECKVCAQNRDTNWWSKENRTKQEVMRIESGLLSDSKEEFPAQLVDQILNGAQNFEALNEFLKKQDYGLKREISVWSRSPDFRARIKGEFDNTCCITGVSGDAINEACHIEPHCENQNNDISNGLYMSRNCHALFDADLLIIDGECRVYIHPDYRNAKEFKWHFGRKLNLPESVCRKLLQARYDESLPNYMKQVEDWKRQNPEKVLPENEPYDENLKSF